MMSAGVRIVGLVAAGAVTAALVMGCSDDDPAPAPEPTTSGSATGQTPTDEPTDEPTESTTTESTAEPSVIPAAGLKLQEETSLLHAPEGDWEPVPDIVDYASAVGLNASVEVIALSDRENFASPASLGEQVRVHLGNLPKGAIVERMPDVLLDGAPAYYIQWYEQGDTKIQHDIGLDHQGRVITVNLDLRRDDPEASNAIVASVLASFRWR